MCSGVQVSKSTLRHFEICTPSDLCTPEHLKQMKIPRFAEAQRGSIENQPKYKMDYHLFFYNPHRFDSLVSEANP